MDITHAQLGSYVWDGPPNDGMSHNVSELIRTSCIRNFYCARIKIIFNIVPVKLNMLGSIMLYWIISNLNDCHIITNNTMRFFGPNPCSFKRIFSQESSAIALDNETTFCFFTPSHQVASNKRQIPGSRFFIQSTTSKIRVFISHNIKMSMFGEKNTLTWS